ncbi:UvrD-helicase domain-containing protein [Thiohalocapsa sp. ML1]|uniref:UvrD-helicase domain-containing protein n=1 Tax=Thiohalocapsa sp. ML1 TaxID=1431688 RepID=UPI0007323001|nr:UvrD-helicase domain-containing protein [Thiohalocapsa sp. ML1]
MHFRIADTFTDSLARLTGEEQKAVKTTAFDLQLNPAHPSFSFHKLERAKDKRFWSVRVSRDIRLIVHRTDESLLLCYVDHHDAAYAWAERRKLEAHPKTGAAQLVEIRETVQEIRVPVYVEQAAPQPASRTGGVWLLAKLDDDVLLGYGVPPEWLAEVQAADEDGLLAIADHLPQEAAEALLELATGGQPQPAAVVAPADAFSHPDAQRRFRVMEDVDALARALAFPWEKWTVFLHPGQRRIVEQDFNGPARVAGSAGTGKTIVALHRAVHLARSDPAARVLLTTFSAPLAAALQSKLGRLVHNAPRLAERIDVAALDAVGERLYRARTGAPTLVDQDTLAALLASAAAGTGEEPRFLLGEWAEVVDAWQLPDWPAYRDVRRLGRKTRLPERRRQGLWSIFEQTRAGLNARGLITRAALFTRVAETLAADPQLVYDHVIVDEAQDVDVAQLRLLAALAGNRPNGLFFAGDLGQRIFRQPFSWKALGVDVRGRSRTLKVNYRTSHQIRAHADRLLGTRLADVDGNVEDRGGTVSVFNGPPPQVLLCDDEAAECTAIARWLRERAADGLHPQEMAVFVRSDVVLGRALAAVAAAGFPAAILDEQMQQPAGQVAVATMHLAKGLEFRAVAVMACDDEVIPLQARIETITDEADLDEVYATERHLLYVACTRARDHLLVTSGDVPSEFLDDFRPTAGAPSWS